MRPQLTTILCCFSITLASELSNGDYSAAVCTENSALFCDSNLITKFTESDFQLKRGQFSIEFWMEADERVTDATCETLTAIPNLNVNETNDESEYSGILISIDYYIQAFSVSCQVGNGQKTITVQTSTLTEFDWSHVICTYDGHDLSLYFNSKFKASLPAEFMPSEQPISYGCEYVKINYISIHNKALSKAEVVEHFELMQPNSKESSASAPLDMIILIAGICIGGVLLLVCCFVTYRSREYFLERNKHHKYEKSRRKSYSETRPATKTTGFQRMRTDTSSSVSAWAMEMSKSKTPSRGNIQTYPVDNDQGPGEMQGEDEDDDVAIDVDEEEVVITEEKKFQEESERINELEEGKEKENALMALKEDQTEAQRDRIKRKTKRMRNQLDEEVQKYNQLEQEEIVETVKLVESLKKQRADKKENSVSGVRY